MRKWTETEIARRLNYKELGLALNDPSQDIAGPA
jgi:hypothetical protein